jgi:hypothetical protein
MKKPRRLRSLTSLILKRKRIKLRKRCIKFRAYHRHKLKKSFLPEKHYLAGFLLVGAFTALLLWSLIRAISGKISAFPPNIDFWYFYKATIAILLMFFILLHGIHVKHKGEKVVSFAWALILVIGSSSKFIRDRTIYSYVEVALYCIGIACCLAFLFMIVEKNIRTSREKKNKCVESI